MKASEIRELLKLPDQPDVISFAGGIPDPALFPAEAFREGFAARLAGEGAGEGAGAALQYSVSRGCRPLRDWIAAEMGRLGVPCGPQNMLITSGSQQALDDLGKLMISPGDTVLVVWPTCPGALGAFNACEPAYDRLEPLGNRTAESFAAQAAQVGGAGGRVKFADRSVDFANPTGETLDRAAREAVLALADRPEIARKGSIEAARTIYCGSFSKSPAPGLRVGWVCAAQEVIGRLVLMKQAADLHSATVNQMVTDRVARGQFGAHVAGLRTVDGARRDRMLAALAREMPQGVTWRRPEGGMFIWLTLPEAVDGAGLLARSPSAAVGCVLARTAPGTPSHRAAPALPAAGASRHPGRVLPSVAWAQDGPGATFPHGRGRASAGRPACPARPGFGDGQGRGLVLRPPTRAGFGDRVMTG